MTRARPEVDVARAVELLDDQQRFVTRSGSVIVLDKVDRRAIRVLGNATETSVRSAFTEMGWAWIDAASGEAVD